MNNFEQSVERRFGLKIFKTCFRDVMLLETYIPILDPARNPDADQRDRSLLLEKYQPIYLELIQDYPGLNHTALTIQGDYFSGGTYKLAIHNMPRGYLSTP